MKKTIVLSILAASILSTGCTRISTGETGVRIGFDKQVKEGELLPGSFNQTLIGDVLTFPVKDVQVDVNDMVPLAADNSTIKDFDMAVIYSLNPKFVSELYVNKNRSFHAVAEDGDILLMYKYVHQIARNAAYKSARKYESLKMNDNRANMEQEIRDIMIASLKDESLNDAITIQQILIRQVLPADSIIQSANELVKAQNELKRKEVEVETARKEAERQKLLAENGPQTVEYMKAQATLLVAEAIKDGKVQTIIVPSNLTMLGNLK